MKYLKLPFSKWKEWMNNKCYFVYFEPYITWQQKIKKQQREKKCQQ